MISIKNKHGLWYSGDQTYDGTPVFLVSDEYRNKYASPKNARLDIARLKEKGIKHLVAVTIMHKED